MDHIYWLLAANVAVWCGLGIYLLFLGQRQRSLAARLVQLESLRHED
ncbi:CcmD family protein [uncultured Desulfovibrio sp.]|nr:CcmD family protein [uncultured Desulfovibrio sp.]